MYNHNVSYLWRLLLPLVDAPLAPDLVKKTLKVWGLPVAARPVLHALVEDWYAGVKLTLALINRVVAVVTLQKYVTLWDWIFNFRKYSDHIRRTCLHPPFLQDSPMVTVPFSSFMTPAFSTIDSASLFKPGEIFGTSLVNGAESESGLLAARASIGALVLAGEDSLGNSISLSKLPVIFSGSTGLTFECFPLSQPGKLRKTVKSVALRLQQVQPL